MLCWLPPFCTYLSDVSGRWSLPQQGEQTVEGRSRSLSQYFYAAVSVITRISTQAKSQGMFNNKLAEADPLHPSMHMSMQFLNGVSVVLACHGHNDSILLLISPVVRNIDFS